MLKPHYPKPPCYYQSSTSSILNNNNINNKKSKKRSTSTSQTKENVSMSHNNSSSLEGHKNGHFNGNNIKIKINKASKEAQHKEIKGTKKTKKVSEAKQSSIFLLQSSQANCNHNLYGGNASHGSGTNQANVKKVVKKSRNNSTSILLPIEDDHLNQNIYEKIEKQKVHNGQSYRGNIFHPQSSKSSTIVSSSTGNIQFSECSKEDRMDPFRKNYFPFNEQPTSTNQTSNYQSSFLQKPSTSKPTFKPTPTKAAIMIQKTWRGYLTRKLLQQYIESFQPIYEEQLKEIRSGRQSRQEEGCGRRETRKTRNSRLSNHKERSSFFADDDEECVEGCQQQKQYEEDQIEECSEIENVHVNDSQSFRGHQYGCEEQSSSSLLLVENSQSRQPSTIRASSSRRKNIEIEENLKNYDFPVQYFKKNKQVNGINTMGQMFEQVNLRNSGDKKSHTKQNSTGKDVSSKETPETISRISEFRVTQKENNFGNSTIPNTCHKQDDQTLGQQTLKFPSTSSRQQPSFSSHNLKLSSRTFSLSIPQPQTSAQKPHSSAPLQSLHYSCTSLFNLFHAFNTSCVNDLKTEIKLNRLSVKQLMERKEALKDIVENGVDFVRNVEEEIVKAFGEMRRIVKDGCDEGEGEREEEEEESDRKEEKQRLHQLNQAKPTQDYTSSPTSQQQTISNQKYIHNSQSSPPSSLQSSSTNQQMNSSSSKKYQPGRKTYNKGGTSEFYTIELPTEEYSAKGKSPIQEDYQHYQQEEEEEGSDRGEEGFEQSYQAEDYDPEGNGGDGYGMGQMQNEDEDCEYQQQQHQTSPTLTLRLNPQFASHQQSLQILNQFLLNLLQQYDQISSQRNISQLQYLCQTLKRVSCDSQNKTIIDRCLIEFIVEIMSETWTLREIYQDGFRKVVERGNLGEENEEEEYDRNKTSEDDVKLLRTVRKWIEQLYKWEMNIIQEVPSKMQSSSFINTENISLHDLRDAINGNLSSNFELDLHQNTDNGLFGSK